MPNQPGIAFSHMGIYVCDLDRMERFYVGFLGFTVTDRGVLETPGGTVALVFLSRDPNEHHQIILATGRPTEPVFNIVNQISFRVDTLQSLRLLYTALFTDEMKAQVTEVMPACHGNALSVYLRDPEGNRLELFVDTPWYVNQPMRIPLDFSMNDEEIQNWAESHAKLLPGFKPRKQWAAEMSVKMGLS